MNDQTPDTAKYTAADIRERLQEYHSGGEWVLQFEVGNGTGGHVKRHADAVAMSIWPSRGYKVHGYEIKVSRQDWLREMREPEKADAVAQFCDAWFLVAPPGIVNEVEVPETWGWLVPSGKSLRIKKQPVVKRAELTRTFIAAMLRRNHGADEARVSALVAKARAGDEARIKEAIERGIKDRTSQLSHLHEAVERFEQQSGISISNRWGGDPNVGRKIKVVEAIGDKWSGVPSLLSRLKSTTDAIEKAYAELMGQPSSQTIDE